MHFATIAKINKCLDYAADSRGCTNLLQLRNFMLANEQKQIKINNTRNVTMKILRERKATWAHKGDKENVNLIFKAFASEGDIFETAYNYISLNERRDEYVN